MNKTFHIPDVVAALKAGQLAIFPTDTVWGIGLAAAWAESPAALFAAKQRSASKPVAWLVGGVDALDVYGQDVGDYARNLVHAYWPGALTVVVKAASCVPRAFQSAAGTIGLRMPAHTACLELVSQVGPLAASSANMAGQEAVGTMEALDPALVEQVAVVLEGQTGSGCASTVVDCTSPTPQVLRQGSILI